MATISLREYLDRQAQQLSQQPQQPPPGTRPVFERPQAPAPQQANQESWGDYLKGMAGAVGHGVSQGATWGALDLFGDAVDPEWQKKVDANSKAHPWANTAGNVAGAVGSMFVPGLREANLVRGATALGRVGWGMAGGALQGGVSSGIEAFREGKGAGDIATQAGIGAGIGTAGGLAGGAIGEGAAPWIGRQLASFTKAAGPENNGATRWASDRMARSMEASGQTPASMIDETAHFPGAWAADHPGMVHAIQDVNRAGGEAQTAFAREATQRNSLDARAARMADDINNPVPTYGDTLDARLAAAQANVGQAAGTLPPVPTQNLRDSIGKIIDSKSAEISDPHLARLNELQTNLWAADQVPGRSLHNTKEVLDQRIGGNGGHGADIEARRAINDALRSKSTPYGDANDAASLLHAQKEAYGIGRQGKNPNAVSALIDDVEGRMVGNPNVRYALTEAHEGGMRDSRNFYGGPMSREKIIERTAGIAQRNPAAIQDAVDVNLASTAAQGAGFGGASGAATAVGTKIGAEMLNNIFRPGQEHAKALAGFLKLTGPEREAILREVAARGEKVNSRTEMIAKVLKNTARGTTNVASDKLEDQLTGKN